MCLLVLAWRAHPRYRLVVAANRDEFHERAAAPLAKWSAPEIFGGRDLKSGGTWLALDRARRFGVVTNFRDMQRSPAGAPSRGELIPQFLAQPAGAGEFLAALAPRADSYAGFNLLLADETEMHYGSNRAPQLARRLAPGIYGLSNHLLDTPWPKLARVRHEFTECLAAPSLSEERVLAILDDRRPALPLEPVPGLTAEWERAIAAPFVLHSQYGTRCSTLVLLGNSGELAVRERRFDARGEPSGETAVALAAGEWL